MTTAQTETSNPTPKTGSLTVQEAQQALRLFWDEADKKYGERSSFSLQAADQKRLIEIERQLDEALRSYVEPKPSTSMTNHSVEQQHQEMNTQNSRESGHTLFVVMILCGIITAALGTYLNLASQEQKTLHRSYCWNAALPMAEAGVEEALSHLNQNKTNYAA